MDCEVLESSDTFTSPRLLTFSQSSGRIATPGAPVQCKMVVIHFGPLPSAGPTARYDILDSAIFQSHVLEPRRKIILSLVGLDCRYFPAEFEFVVHIEDATKVSQASGIMLDSGLLGEAHVRFRWPHCKQETEFICDFQFVEGRLP